MATSSASLPPSSSRSRLSLPSNESGFSSVSPSDKRGATPENETLLSEYFNLLRRHWGKIMLAAAAGAALVLLATMLVQPSYQAHVSLDIQGLNGDFMGMHEVSRTGDNSAESREVDMQTQIKLFQSDSLLRRTSASLLNDPHPAMLERQDILSRMLRALHAPDIQPLQYASVVTDTADNVKVKPLGMTRLVELTCTSHDAKVAAAYCNRLTREFESEDIETRAAEAQKTSSWLTRQLADVRQKAEDSQRRLEAEVGGNGLMLSQQTSSTGEERLRDLQTELVRAQADRMQKEAASSQARLSSPDTLPEVLDNPAYRQYATRIADLRGKIAELVPPLTEENPKVIHLRSELRDAEAGLAASRTTSTGRQGNELAAARHREDLLQVAYNAQLANVSSDLQKTSRVSLLRREVESEQQLYQTMLQRAKEAGFALAMQASSIRVVDAAKPPPVPASPSPVKNGIGGASLGALVGIGFFFYRERNLRVFRRPGETTGLLQVEELGVIPHAFPAKRGVTASTSPRLLTANQNSGQNSYSSEALAITHWEDRFSVIAEAYRSVTFSILLLNMDRGSRTYVVSSPSDGEGKTTVVSNLAVALSKSRLRVLLIDGDLRKPRLHKIFGLKLESGVRNLLRGDLNPATTPVEQVCKPTDVPNLSVMTAGTGSENSVELLHSPQVAMLLDRMKVEFDIVLIDTPPMLHMADARLLAGVSDGAILILRANSTSIPQAEAARDLFERDGVQLIGTILNDFNPQREGVSDYYSSYERYSTTDKDKQGASS